MTDLFEAARAGDAATVRARLAEGADPAALNAHGFNALQCAGMGANQAAVEGILDVMRALLEAGAPVDAVGEDPRTALYLAAEFAKTPEPVQLLVDAGANPDAYDGHGNHVVINAMTTEVKALLSELTGRPIPPPPPPRPKPVKMKAAEWRAAKARLDVLFEGLEERGMIVLQDAGTTQSDGFSDCVEVWHRRGKPEIVGFCFYTRQDLNRAKRTSELSLAFWGYPDGEPPQMERAGALVVEAFRDAGYDVDWNGSGGMRPIVYLAGKQLPS